MAKDSIPLPSTPRFWSSLRRRIGRPGSAPDAAFAVRHVGAVTGARRIPRWAQLKEAPRFLSPKERRVGIAALVLGLLSLGTLGSIFAGDHFYRAPAVGGTFTEALLGSPRLINPLYATASDVDADLARLVFSGLLRWDGAALVPDVAQGFTLDEAGTTYTFTLRNDVRFHDGETLTAGDVAFTLEAIKNPQYGSPLFAAFSGATITVVDDTTLTITIPEASSAFPALLTVGILPAHRWTDIPPVNAQLHINNLKPIGSGPYRFSEFAKDSDGTLRSMTLTRNADFFGTPAYLKKLTFKFAGTSEELAQLIRGRQVDAVATVSAQDALQLRDAAGIDVHEFPLTHITGVIFNTAQTGASFADAAVRRALALAIPRGEDQSTPRFPPALALPGLAGIAVGEDLDAAARQAAVSAALEAAGWVFGEGMEWRTKNGAELGFALTFLDTPDLRAIAEGVEGVWKPYGVHVTLAPVAQEEWERSIRDRSFAAALTTHAYGAIPDPFPFWHSSQITAPGLNISGYSAAAVDTAIRDLRAAKTAEARATAGAAFAAALAEGAPAVFLGQPVYRYVVNSDVRGIDLPTLFITTPSDRFASITQWFRKTKLLFRWRVDAETAI